MIHWVTFDDETTDFIASRLQVSPELASSGDALQSSLRVSTGTSFALLPSSVSEEEILLARFSWKQAPKTGLSERRPAPEKRDASQAPPATRPGYQAGGFLGLSDEEVSESEETRPAKNWWRKVLD